MKAKDLARRLLENPEMEIMILDGFNGGGVPRTINLGPIKHHITAKEGLLSADCGDRLWEEVLLIGFGSY